MTIAAVGAGLVFQKGPSGCYKFSIRVNLIASFASLASLLLEQQAQGGRVGVSALESAQAMAGQEPVKANPEPPKLLQLRVNNRDGCGTRLEEAGKVNGNSHFDFES